jgi:PIN domain nuclease of toxin-antitoxin system
MVVELERSRPDVSCPPATVILLDTNAVIWLDLAHPRSRPLTRIKAALYVSPATLLELQFLTEANRIRLMRGDAQALASDDRWLLDDPPAAAWFAEAIDLNWTRDPFDRLIAAHAQLRGWRVATGDTRLLQALGARKTLEL